MYDITMRVNFIWKIIKIGNKNNANFEQTKNQTKKLLLTQLYLIV